MAFFNVDEYANYFKTTEHEAYFWHGETNGIGGQDNAMKIAEANNGKTLEMCMLENREELEAAGVHFEDVENEETGEKHTDIWYGDDKDSLENIKFWEDCSQSFAEQASGDVHVIEGTDDRPNGQSEDNYHSTWNDTEYSALTDNENVNSITSVNAETGEETGKVFSREQGEEAFGPSGDGFDHIGGSSEDNGYDYYNGIC